MATYAPASTWRICSVLERRDGREPVPGRLDVPRRGDRHSRRTTSDVQRGLRALRSTPPAVRAAGLPACSAALARDGQPRARAPREDALHRVVLRGRHPAAVAPLDRDLAGDVGAAERLVGRQPARGVAVALLAVGRRVDREQVERVVGEATRRSKVHCCAPVCHASPSATTWSMSTSEAPPRSKRIAVAVYGSASTPLCTSQSPPGSRAIRRRSRSRIRSRVSQPSSSPSRRRTARGRSPSSARGP